MNISVPSRFACLKVEDDEPSGNRKAQDKGGNDKQTDRKGAKDTRKNNNQKQMSNTATKKNKKVNKQMQKQWEEWKEKDDKLVNGNFEQDLESAILLSKLHYEENKDKYDHKKMALEKKTDKKKKKVMSLNEFLAPKEKVVEDVEVPVKSSEKDFFEKVQNDAKLELDKDKLKDKRKERESDIEEIISSAQYQERLEVERKKNKKLIQQLKKAKEEIADVKMRNSTLCTMLSTGEMKDKVDVLLELERLTTIKNELTEEVTRLHTLLEQERSKSANVNDKHKDKAKK